MNWYSVKIVFQICIGEHNRSQFDIQHRLFAADDESQAYAKAYAAGKREEEVFTNKRNETVAWKFAGVQHLHKLPELSDGLLVDSGTLETTDPESFLQRLQVEEPACTNAIVNFPL